jgi:D-alanyl-D-alanine carboxypeptidase
MLDATLAGERARRRRWLETILILAADEREHRRQADQSGKVGQRRCSADGRRARLIDRSHPLPRALSAALWTGSRRFGKFPIDTAVWWESEAMSNERRNTAALRRDLKNALDVFLAHGIVGAALAVAQGEDPLFVVTSGLADRTTGRETRPDDLFKIGSCTKTFVAATLLSLVEEQRVSLSAPISDWFFDIPNARNIVVRRLLDHTSGLPEFEYDMPMEPGRRWTPREVVDFAFSVHPANQPGARCVYCNTGYVVAGMLVEELTGDTLAAAIRARVLQPLGLRDTYAAAGEAFPTDRLARGYYHRPPRRRVAAGEATQGAEMWRTDGALAYSDGLQDATDLFPWSGAYAAGDMVGTAADLAQFIGVLVSGRLIGAPMTAEMIGKRRKIEMAAPATRMRESGAGVFALNYAGRQVFGHQGSMPGYVTLMLYEPESRTGIGLTTNTGSGDRLSFYASGLHDFMDIALARCLRQASLIQYACNPSAPVKRT